ncbi:MAG: carboxypeptidase regulatory-like domain-containing protein [Geobacteraceae bacterium]|nr:carboxypeptidase regulatory-like domain-containing protein [Geobacteraceae bacterium]
MKNAARVAFLVLCIIWLATAGSIPAQADVVSLGILPVQDESGAQVPPELLRKVAQDFKQKLILSYQDILARSLTGESESSSQGVEQLSAMGRQQGMQYVLRSGVLGLLSEKSGRELKCEVGLYAELVSSQSGAIVSLRANGSGSEEDPAINDARSWDAYNFKSSAFAQSALGQALSAAIDQLAQQVGQAVTTSGQATPEAVAAESQTQSPTSEEAAISYEADQELQQLIAEADSLVASGAANGRDISLLQQALEGLRTALDNKVSLMTEGQDTSTIDQEIDQIKNELQNIIAASTQEAITQPPEGEPQAASGEMQTGISKVNELLGEALNSILKIQELCTAVQSFNQDQTSASPDMGEDYLPIEEPTSDVSGVVVDDFGNPVEGATVSDPQSGASATTDSSGSYIIPRIPSGRFATMKVFKAGRQLSSGKIQLQPGRMAFADWQTGTGGSRMKAPGIKILSARVIIASKAGIQKTKSGTIKGVVRDDHGKPVTRALVMVKGLGMARTDSQGRYMFVNVPQGEYQVMIRKGGATVQTERVRVAAKKVLENTTLYKGKAITAPAFGKQAFLTHGAGVVLTGKVVNKYRQPISGAKVTAVCAGGAMSVLANVNGTYEFKGLKNGTYRLLANKAGYQEASGNVSLKGTRREVFDFTLENSSTEIRKVLSVRPSTTFGRKKTATSITSGRTVIAAKGNLSGVVRDARSGKPIDGVTVQVYGRAAARTDRYGSYRINDVLPGTYRVVVSHRDYQQEDKTVTIRANSTSKEYFSLKSKDRQDIKTTTTPLLLKTFARYGQVQGRIIDSKTGNPVSQATVTFANQETRSGASGDYSFRNIPVGSYTMTIEKTNYQDGRRRITVKAGKTISADFRLVPKLGFQLKKRSFPSVSPAGIDSK